MKGRQEVPVMTLTINVSPELEATLTARAKAQSLSAEQYAAHVLENELTGGRPQSSGQLSVDEIARDFVQWASSHRYTPPLSDAAVSRAAMYPDHW